MPSGGKNRGLVIGAIIAAVLFFMLATLGVLGIFGMRRYVGAAKTAEVRNSLGQIAKDAVVAYETEYPAPEDDADTITRRICPSASLPVPVDPQDVSGKKYQSARSDWEVDKARNAGFSCLRFEMVAPQYYQYTYEATPGSFLAGGRGDLDGNGKFSSYTIEGRVEQTRLHLAPQIAVTDPDE